MTSSVQQSNRLSSVLVEPKLLVFSNITQNSKKLEKKRQRKRRRSRLISAVARNNSIEKKEKSEVHRKRVQERMQTM